MFKSDLWKVVRRQMLFALIAFGLLPVISSNVFSQSKKLVKCRVKGKIVYRKKCRAKKLVRPDVTLIVINKTPGSQKYGDPNSSYMMSDGPGTGGGQGSGRGTGTGLGTDVGTGRGQGNGSGTGNTELPKSPPQADQNPTIPLQITYKPKADYTTIAREAGVQGSVTLRITFLSNGTIGAVSPVSGLPHGLTEQAIDAAKRIRFQPEMKNGKPVTVVKQFIYNFMIY